MTNAARTTRRNTPAKRIGIFAGTFDPIHEGHLAFAKAALEHGLEKVMFLIEPRPRRKQGVRAFEHRLAMVQLAVADEPAMGAIVLEQARFTVHETLPVLQERFKGYRLVLLFGDDVMGHIAHWPHVNNLVQSAGLLIAGRRNDGKELRRAMQALERTRGLKFEYDIMQAPRQRAASSTIRLQLKRREQPAGLAPVVYDYIRRHRLYASGSAGK